MQKIDRYIFVQIASAFSFFLLVLTIVFWINRVIRLFDKLIIEGQNSSALLKLALMSLPSIFTIAFPFACLAASIFVTHRLKSDSEIIILQNSGLSPWRLVKPFFIFGIISMVVLGFITTILEPRAAKELYKNRIELDNSISARFLKEGKFIHPTKGITLYIKEIEENGTLLDILLHDSRSNEQVISYTANQAFLAKNDLTTSLYMENGLIQTIQSETQSLSTTKFESIVIDLSNFIGKKPSDRIYLSHLPTWSLLFEVQQVMIITQINRALINLELHTRFHQPIFCFVAALLGFSCILVGSHTKFGLGKQISLAIVTVIFIKIIESYTTKIAVSTHLLWPVIYTPSLVGILTNLLLLKISSAKLKLNWRLEK